MKLKRKKKNQIVIPKNITKQNIDLFNKALDNNTAPNSTQGNGSANVIDVSENLNESANTKAWMIRKDGKIFEMASDKFHPYGNQDDYEETLYAAEWLYDHTSNAQVKEKIIKFIAAWVYDETEFNAETVAEQIYDEIDDRPYVFLTKKFVKGIADQLENADITNVDLEELNKEIINDLNNEFMRVRAGGEVNSDYSLGDLYFRISSEGFNWYDIIWKFVYDRQSSTDSVTIISDEESTGVKKFYKHNGKVFDRMPTEEFIMMKGNPVVENLNEKFDYSNYLDDDIEDAMNSLRNDFVSDSAMLEQFFDWCTDDELLGLIERDFGIGPGDEFTETDATNIINEYLYDICMVVDESYIQKYLEDHERKSYIGESLVYHFGKDNEDEYIYEPSEEECAEVVNEYIKNNSAEALELLLAEYLEPDIKELVDAGYKVDYATNTDEENLETINELKTDWTYEDLAEIFLLQTDLLKHCRKNAEAEYEDDLEYNKDPEGYWYNYNGVSREDFV